MTTRERLVEAAVSLLDAGGEAAVTMRAVGKAAGISHNAPYRHFADRAALLAGVAERDFAALTDTFAAIEGEDSSPFDRLRRALDAFVDYGETNPARYRLLFGDPAIAAHGGGLETTALGTFAAFARLVAEAQEGRGLPAMATPALAGLIFAAVHGLIDLQSGGRLRAEKGASDAREGVANLLSLLASSKGSR